MATRAIRRTARFMGRGLNAVSQVIDGLQLRLRAIDVSRDPETKRWVADMRAQVQRREIDAVLAAQPDDPRVIVDRVRRSAAT